MAEFLPLCDVLFNVISMAGYFCDVVFDVVMGYALLERGYKGTFAAAMSIIITSLVISQVLSLRWYLHVWWAGEERKGRLPWLPAALHCLQLGVLWRYARLLVPVSLRHVKHQVRDLCMLRLVHAFCEAAPMLLLQLHVALRDAPAPGPGDPPAGEPAPTPLHPSGNVYEAGDRAFAELAAVSASLSLFSVCWALASFSKNVRLHNVHRLVLTWLGVIFQFLWRLGTISARVCALTVYALVYEYWVFLVIGLHWVSMFLWLISPKNAFHGERISRARKAYLSALIAFVYVFAYVNLQELNHRQKMVTFYCVMCVENCLLMVAWWCAAPRPRAAPLAAPLVAPLAAAAAFGAGLLFMLLYYRYFHVRRLGYMLGERRQGTNSTNGSADNNNGKPSSQADNAAIPGVFNCRFSNPVANNAANGRKKKKPTSFVPPPAAPATPATPAPAPAPAPATAFWRRPLPAAHHHHGGSSENEGSSVGSRVNIQQKLHEKKQKQLAELRVIEEEIRQGKLAHTAPVPADELYTSLRRQPIPRAKTHAAPAHVPAPASAPAPAPAPAPAYRAPLAGPQAGRYGRDARSPDTAPRPPFYESPVLRASYLAAGLRGRTPEILLAPHYLDGCCRWGAPYGKKEECGGGGGGAGSSGEGSAGGPARDTPRPPSDIDSQISLPRSYTLPREFRYWRRRPRLHAHAHAPSNNSSDGDVDSADNDSDRRSNCSAASQLQSPTYGEFPYHRHDELERRARRPHALRKQAPKPETKL